jgi:hypothetical protein
MCIDRRIVVTAPVTVAPAEGRVSELQLNTVTSIADRTGIESEVSRALEWKKVTDNFVCTAEDVNWIMFQLRRSLG